jgi:hypothetical protein
VQSTLKKGCLDRDLASPASRTEATEPAWSRGRSCRRQNGTTSLKIWKIINIYWDTFKKYLKIILLSFGVQERCSGLLIIFYV